MGNCLRPKTEKQSPLVHTNTYLFMGFPVKPVSEVSSLFSRCKKRSQSTQNSEPPLEVDDSESDRLLLDIEGPHSNVS
jgi:hypothetical protein